MKLKEFVEQFEDGKDLYISTGTAWQFIGNKEELAKYMPDIEERVHNVATEAYLAAHSKKLDLMQDTYLPSLRGRTAISFARFLINWGTQLYEAEVAFQKCKARLDAYVPLMDREIKETFEKDESMPGMGVVIEGKEKGAFWFKEEFVKAYVLGEGLPKSDKNDDDEEKEEEEVDE